MSLDATLNIIYGYRLKGTPINDKINEFDNCDDLYDKLSNPDKDNFVVCEDSMSGRYEYVGIELHSESSDYGEDNHIGFDLNQLKQLMDDELLDKCIQKNLPWLVGKEYDVCGLMNGQLPKLWIFKKVW